MRLILHWLVTALALVVAALLVPGIRVEGGGIVAVLVTAAVLGLVNAFVRPMLRFLACGCILLTLGLFLLVINGITLWLAAYISHDLLGVGFVVSGFWPAFWGAIVVSVVSFLFSALAGRDDWERR